LKGEKKQQKKTLYMYKIFFINDCLADIQLLYRVTVILTGHLFIWMYCL